MVMARFKTCNLMKPLRCRLQIVKVTCQGGKNYIPKLLTMVLGGRLRPVERDAVHSVVQLLIPDRPGVAHGQELPANRLQGPPHVDDGPAVLVLVVGPLPRGQVVHQPADGAVVGLVDVDVVRRQEAAVGHSHVWPLGVLFGVAAPVPLADEVGNQPHVTRSGAFSRCVSVLF